MKKILYKYSNRLLLSCMVLTFLLLAACEEDDNFDQPVITEVRNYAASPDDTVVQTIQAGQWVVVMGENLSRVTQVLFGSVPATVNRTFFTDQSIVVQVPSIPFQSVVPGKLNELTLITNGGAATFSINITGAPLISLVRNFADSPNDTIVDVITPGQQINIVGYNLKSATAIAFQGIPADLANVVYTDSSVVVRVPEELSGSDASLANTISVTTEIGTGTFAIKILGPPTVTRVSYEVPKEGDQVYLYGNNFSSIQSITFAGVEISSFEVTEDEKRIGFIAPALTESGPVVVTTLGGTFTSAYNVNDKATGAISNYEWDGKFQWDWWGGASLAVEDPSLNEGWISVFPEFSGNGSKFLALNVGALASGAGADWNTAIRITGGNAVPWFPSADNLSDPANSWALKFEINVSENWNGGTLIIKTNNSDYMVRYEPWQVSPTKTVDFKTDGWQTVVIPLNSFRRNDATLGEGKGAPIVTIDELFNMGSTTADLVLYLHNYGAADTPTGLRSAFDNFRVVRQ